jgi:hypothetical protein
VVLKFAATAFFLKSIWTQIMHLSR